MADRRDPLLRDRCARARQVAGVVTLGPLAVDARAVGLPGLLLAGDAAGFVDPMTGDGIHIALRGGMLAAEALLDSRTSDDRAVIARLSDARRSAFGAKGAQVPVIVRAAVAMFWFAVQTYAGSVAINAILGELIPGWKNLDGEFLGMALNNWLSISASLELGGDFVDLIDHKNPSTFLMPLSLSVAVGARY